MAAPAGVYFLTSRSQWNDYVLPVYALSGAAGLLGVVCDLLEIADLAPASGAGIAFLVPVGPSGDHARRRRSRHRQIRTTGLVPGVRGPTVLRRA